MKNTLEKIINYAVSIAEPEEVILFGSMTGNHANEYSDIDLLIISKGLDSKRDIKAKLVSFANEVSLKIDVLVYSKDELKNELLKPNSFTAAVYNGGKIVYKR